VPLRQASSKSQTARQHVQSSSARPNVDTRASTADIKSRTLEHFVAPSTSSIMSRYKIPNRKRFGSIDDKDYGFLALGCGNAMSFAVGKYLDKILEATAANCGDGEDMGASRKSGETVGNDSGISGLFTPLADDATGAPAIGDTVEATTSGCQPPPGKLALPGGRCGCKGCGHIQRSFKTCDVWRRLQVQESACHNLAAPQLHSGDSNNAILNACMASLLAVQSLAQVAWTSVLHAATEEELEAWENSFTASVSALSALESRIRAVGCKLQAAQAGLRVANAMPSPIRGEPMDNYYRRPRPEPRAKTSHDHSGADVPTYSSYVRKHWWSGRRKPIVIHFG
jgi:hypothetical protein